MNIFREKLAQQCRSITTKCPPVESQMITSISCLPPFLSKAFLQQKYEVEMLSTRQISRLILSARSTVAKYLKLYGVVLRSEDEAHRLNKGQAGFGEKKGSIGFKAHQREQVCIQKMASLRSKGFSYWKIAAVLNSMGVPTKTRRAKWQAATVMKILKKAGPR